MPIYEYKCDNCDHTLEKIQKFSDDPLLDCPECNSPSLVKQISRGNFCLMGGNWHNPGMHASRRN